MAHAQGKPLALQSVSRVFEVRGEDTHVVRQPLGKRLWMLAVFSLPTDTRSLNLRQEHFQLARLIRGIARRRGLAIDLRVLQYGVTRQALQRILEEGEGWDVLHFSGHLLRGEKASDGPQREQHRTLVAEVLKVVQGHPKLLDLAEGQAADLAALRQHLERAARAGWGRSSRKGNRR